MSVGCNPPQSMIFRTRLLLLATLLVLVLPQARAADWKQPVAALARKIAALTGPGQVQIIVKNRSSVKPDEVAEIEALLRRDLSA